MTEPLQQRANERLLYEVVVNTIVDMVAKEFPKDGKARLRVYTLIADNFHGMVKSFEGSGKAVGIEENNG